MGYFRGDMVRNVKREAIQSACIKVSLSALALTSAHALHATAYAPAVPEATVAAHHQWPTPAVAPIAEQSSSDGAFRNLMLISHNQLRSRFGIEALQWDEQLASDAWRWAGELARRDRMEHSHFNERKGQGENLATGITRYHSMDLLVNLWVKEEPMVKAGIFPDVSRTGQFSDVGHFTQMVWKRTQKVGCGQQSNGTNSYLVCRYYPAGNALGAEFNFKGGQQTALNDWQR